MKTTKHLIVYMLLACIGLYSCQEFEEPINNIPTVTTHEAMKVGTTTAFLTGEFSLKKGYSSAQFLLSTSENFEDCIYMDASRKGLSFYANVENLAAGTTYYCLLSVTDGRSEVKGNVVTFTTKSSFEFNSVYAFTWYEGDQELAEGSAIGSFFYYDGSFHINNVKSVYNGSQWTSDKDVTPTEQMLIYSYSPYTESYEMGGNQVYVPVENNGTDYLYGVSEYVAGENTPTNLHMSNAMSCIRFKIQKTEDCDIDGTVREVQIVNADNAKLCANGWLHLTTGDIEPSGEYLDLVSIGCKFELSDNSSTTVERLMFPTSFGEGQLKIGIKIAQTGEIIYTNLPASEWEKGQSYEYPIILTKVEEVLTEGEAIDLGLSVKWASFNVGATAPEEYGDYFAWSETTTKSSYDKDNNVTYGLSTSELKSRGIIGSDGNLTAAYDAATVNWGSAWRMPTLDEIKELLNNCTWTWTTQNGVKGSKVTGPNGNSIFLPAAGYRSGTDLDNAGSFGYYWSATPDSYSSYAYYLLFYSDYYDWYYDNRYYGRAVRPVSE